MREASFDTTTQRGEAIGGKNATYLHIEGGGVLVPANFWNLLQDESGNLTDEERWSLFRAFGHPGEPCPEFFVYPSLFDDARDEMMRTKRNYEERLAGRGYRRRSRRGAYAAARRALVQLDKTALAEIASGPTSQMDTPRPDAEKRQEELNNGQA